MEEQSKHTDNDEDGAPEEASSSGHVVNMYRAHKKCQRRTLRISPKRKLIVTISVAKCLPLHLGKHKKRWDCWWGRLSIGCPKVGKTKQIREDSSGQEYVHEKQAAEHSIGQHEHPFFLVHLSESTIYRLQHYRWHEEKLSEQQFVWVS